MNLREYTAAVTSVLAVFQAASYRHQTGQILHLGTDGEKQHLKDGIRQLLPPEWFARLEPGLDSFLAARGPSCEAMEALLVETAPTITQ